jgi:hypothetical protein
MPRDPEDLFRQGQERLEQMMPAGGPGGVIAIAVIALVALAEPTTSAAMCWRASCMARAFPCWSGLWRWVFPPQSA